jgi:ABC-2 type transport system permease protein
VLVAKLAAGVVLSIVALLIWLVVSAVATTLAAPGVEHTWSLPVGTLGQFALYLATAMIGGVAFGAAFLASAPAIVANFALPLGWAALGSMSALEGTARWVDATRSLEPTNTHLMSPTEWARAGTTLALWLLLPLVIGLWRIARGEIR